MPRFVVERTFPDGLEVPITERGALACSDVVGNNSEENVTWVTSYVSQDKHRTFCIYDGPSVEAIERAGLANGLPVDDIHEVRVLDPYFYVGPTA